MFCYLLLRNNIYRRRKIRKVEEEIQYLISEKKETVAKAHVDRRFLKNLVQLLKIIIPGWASTESGLLVLVALSLIARSLCDLWMINNGTKIERYIHLFYVIIRTMLFINVICIKITSCP